MSTKIINIVSILNILKLVEYINFNWLNIKFMTIRLERKVYQVNSKIHGHLTCQDSYLFYTRSSFRINTQSKTSMKTLRF